MKETEINGDLRWKSTVTLLQVTSDLIQTADCTNHEICHDCGINRSSLSLCQQSTPLYGERLSRHRFKEQFFIHFNHVFSPQLPQTHPQSYSPTLCLPLTLFQNREKKTETKRTQEKKISK